MTLTAMHIAAMHTRLVARAVDASTIPVIVAFLPIVTYYVRDWPFFLTDTLETPPWTACFIACWLPQSLRLRSPALRPRLDW